MHTVIRKFQPSDHEAVRTLFRHGVMEHFIPTFISAISHPFHVSLTLCFFIGGYILTGGSVVLALLAGGSWICLVLYCCYEFYAGYVRLHLNTDMRDITAWYLSNPENCFWVAAAEVNGHHQIMGTVAVVATTSSGRNNQKYGELYRMSVSSTCRHMGLGSRLTRTAEDFCKDAGFSKIVLETTSTQLAAIALYGKMGFKLLRSPYVLPWWVPILVRATIVRMEKLL